MNTELWGIEFNMDYQNVLDNHSWHIDLITKQIVSNLNIATNKEDKPKWLLLEIASSLEEAIKKRDQLKRLLFTNPRLTPST